MQYRLVKLIVRNRVAVRVVQACFAGLFPGFVCCRLVEYSSSYGAYNKPASYGCLRQKRLIGQKHVTYLYQMAYRSELMRDEAYIRREGQGEGLGQGHRVVYEFFTSCGLRFLYLFFCLFFLSIFFFPVVAAAWACGVRLWAAGRRQGGGSGTGEVLPYSTVIYKIQTKQARIP